MIIRTNVSAVNANRLADINSKNVDSDMSKLSSGSRINKASDDPSGLAVSQRMLGQIKGLNRASKNVSDATSFIQTAEGYLNETQDILTRVREISVQSGNGVYTDSDRMQIQVEVSQLMSEIDRVASHASFNNLSFLTGRFSKENGQAVRFHVGANADQFIEMNIGTMTLNSLGLKDQAGATAISMSTPDKANQSLSIVDSAIASVSRQRADLGAYQSRLSFMAGGIDVAAQNLLSAKSNIADANMAEEMVNFSRDNILQQTSVAMLAQANVKNQGILRLL